MSENTYFKNFIQILENWFLQRYHWPMLLLCSHPVMSDSSWPFGLQHCRSPCSSIFWSLPKFMLFASVMLSSDHILWCPLLLLLSIFPSIGNFSNGLSVRIRWANYWSWSFSISPSSEDSELISLKIGCFDLLAVQGTFRSFLQHHSLKVSILWCSAFFTAQLSHLNMTTGKNIALTIQTFVSRVIYIFAFQHTI